MGVVQLVVRKDDGELLALADYRKGGVAAGYRWPIKRLKVKYAVRRNTSVIFCDRLNKAVSKSLFCFRAAPW